MRIIRKKNAVKIFLALTIFIAIIFAVLSQFIERSGRVVVARVNGEEILKSELERKLHTVLGPNDANLKTLNADNLSKESLELLIKEIYLDKELVKIAKKSKESKTPEAKEDLIEAQNSALRHIYFRSVLNKEITDQKISEKYQEISKTLIGKQEYLIYHILVSSRDEADKIIKEMKERKSSPSFSELAKKYSIDTASSGNGGRIGYVLQSSLVKEIGSILPELKKDEVSQPVQTKFGWHLVKVADIREISIAGLDDVKDDLRRVLAKERVSQINSGIVKNAKTQILMAQKNNSEIDSATSSIQQWIVNRDHPNPHHGNKPVAPKLQSAAIYNKSIMEDHNEELELQQTILAKSDAKSDAKTTDQQLSDKKVGQ